MKTWIDREKCALSIYFYLWSVQFSDSIRFSFALTLALAITVNVVLFFYSALPFRLFLSSTLLYTSICKLYFLFRCERTVQLFMHLPMHYMRTMSVLSSFCINCKRCEVRVSKEEEETCMEISQLLRSSNAQTIPMYWKLSTLESN